jgi:hypothetical protein
LTDTNLRSNVGAVEFYEKHGFDRQAVILRKRLTSASATAPRGRHLAAVTTARPPLHPIPRARRRAPSG